MSQDNTPTESLVGFDGDGVLPERAHVTCACCARPLPRLDDQLDPGDDDYKKLCRYCFDLRMAEEKRKDIAQKSMTFSERLRASHYIEPVLPKPDDLAYMAPERVEEMLRRCNHVCRTNGCGQVVDRCGQHCEDCQGYIDFARKTSEDITRKASKAGWLSLWTILPAVIGLIWMVLLLKWWWEASK